MGLESGCFCGEPMNVVLFVDVTVKMIKKSNAGRIIITFLRNFVNRINFGPTTLSIYFYGHNKLQHEPATTLIESSSLEDAIRFIESIDISSFSEYRRRQPMVAIRRFLKSKADVLTSTKKTVILSVIAGQDDYDKSQVQSVISLARRRTVAISTIALGSRAKEYSHFAQYDARGLHFYIARTVKFLTTVEALDELLGQVCELPKMPSRPFKPTTVEKFQCDVKIVADIMLVLDGSFSTRPVGFKTIISFLKSVIESTIGDIQYGAIQYSDRVVTEFPFAKRTRQRARIALSAVEYDGGWSTLTGAALRDGWSKLHDRSFGARSHTTKIILLVTDGRTKDDISTISQEIRDANDTTVIAVGLYRAPLEELLTIASGQEYAFYTKSIAKIWRVFAGLMEKICHVPDHEVELGPELTTPKPLTTLTTSLGTIVPVETVKPTGPTSLVTTVRQVTAVETVQPTPVSTTTLPPIPTKATPITVILFPSDFTADVIQEVLVDLPLVTNITVVVGDTVVVNNQSPEDTEITDEIIDALPVEPNVTATDILETMNTEGISLEDNLFIPIITANNIDSVDEIAASTPILMNPIQIGVIDEETDDVVIRSFAPTIVDSIEDLLKDETRLALTELVIDNVMDLMFEVPPVTSTAPAASTASTTSGPVTTTPAPLPPVYLLPSSLTPDELNTIIEEIPEDTVTIMIGPLVFVVDAAKSDIPPVTTDTLDDEIFDIVTSQEIFDNLEEIKPDLTNIPIIPFITAEQPNIADFLLLSKFLRILEL